ncbi:Ribokinase-like protein [Mycena galopus ATCC 62051]|nr:Ribokinase-like protein [Mycena galopus ATCC 62051]
MPARCLVRGSVNVDEFFQGKPDIVRPGETISSDNLVKRPGGKGANQAGALARAGVIVDLVGAVGEDGIWVRDELKETGVGVEAVSIVKENTGRALIQVNEVGENSIILYKGANYASIPSHAIHTERRTLFFKTRSLIIHPRIPHARFVVTGLHNIQPIADAHSRRTQDLSLAPTDWLIVNSGEALDLCQALGLEVPDSRRRRPPLTSRSPCSCVCVLACPRQTSCALSVPTACWHNSRSGSLTESQSLCIFRRPSCRVLRATRPGLVTVSPDIWLRV